MGKKKRKSKRERQREREINRFLSNKKINVSSIPILHYDIYQSNLIVKWI